ncbi:unnamed protein product, partial [Arabidopsis halleri]
IALLEAQFGISLTTPRGLVSSFGLLDPRPFPNPWCLPRQEIQVINSTSFEFYKETPVVIWLIGGPGCSSELAMLYENSPFKITNKTSHAWNEYGLLSL